MADPADQLGLARAAAVQARSAADWVGVARLYADLERLCPGDHRPAANCGHALWLADLPEQALRAYRRAALLAPDEAIVLRGLGTVHSDLNSFELADRAYQRSLLLEPTADTAWNHSQLLIGLERYAAGYALAEVRWDLPGVEHWRRHDGAAARSPEDLRGPLLVWSEQGFGDTLQHLRWLGPLLRLRGADGEPLILEVEAPLAVLLREALPDGGGRRMEIQVKCAGGGEPWAGRHCSLLSLPWLLGGAPIPEVASWLQADRWAQTGAGRTGRPRIGLVWGAGRKLEDPVTAREYRRRSLDPEALGALICGIAERGMDPVLLQFGEDRAWAEPWLERVAEQLPASADFAETAAVVAGLDLVISVDTAMAHLVGAMRRPGWVLLPFSAAPRWLRHRADTPWYPTLRLFRQPGSGAWGPVVDAVLAALGQGPPW